jgi:hypothetical protein
MRLASGCGAHDAQRRQGTGRRHLQAALGRVDSSDADEIACWFIDTDHDEEPIFVRHACFPVADIPYRAIRTTLKAEIYEAREGLKAAISRPFPKTNPGVARSRSSTTSAMRL